MAWSNANGTETPDGVFAGPRSGDAGPGMAHLFEGASARAYPVSLESLRWNRAMGPSGPGLLLTAALSPARAVPGHAQLHLWLQSDAETYAEAVLDDYADADGDLCAVGELLRHDTRSVSAAVYLPWAAVPALKGDCLCQVSVVAGDQLLGNQWFELSVPGRATREVHSPLGALAYAAVAMLQQSREVSEAELSGVVRGMTALFALDPVGQELAAKLLERAERQRPDFEKVLQLVTDEIAPLNQPEVVRLLEELAASKARPSAAFIRKLGQSLGLADAGPRTTESPIDQAYRALELEPGAGIEQVRAAYRRLALDYHPDKVETLAVGFREYATARMQAINEAYERLKKHLGGR